jgi:tetratricopeptide (TPR) repeat protein
MHLLDRFTSKNGTMRITRKAGNLLFRSFAGLVAASLLTTLSVSARAGDLSRAENLYNSAQYSASASLLQGAKDAASLFLLGRDKYMLAEFKKATDYLQKAVAAEPDNSQYLDWLGRAYGKRAQTASPLSAPGLASKSRQMFERAVTVNPKDTDALADLFEYYLEAPGFLGGGYDKAEAVAEKMSAVDPAEGFFEQAELAQKRQRYRVAENDLRKSVALSPNNTGHVLALAKLLGRQGNQAESDALFRKAEELKPNSPKVWFARAQALIQQKRDLPEAKALLEKYVSGPTTAEDPPRQEAMALLKQAGGGA